MARRIVTIHNSRIFLVLVLSCIWANAQVVAEDKALNFFEKDFAKSPTTADSKPDQKEQQAPKPSQDLADKSGFMSDQEDEQTQSQTSEESIMDKAVGLPVLSISAVLSAKEIDHVFENLALLNNLVVRYKIKPKMIYVVGYIDRISDAPLDWARLGMRGGQIALVDAPPGKYNVTSSPSWIIETKKGEILIEGHKSFEKFINSKGEFIQSFLGDENV